MNTIKDMDTIISLLFRLAYRVNGMYQVQGFDNNAKYKIMHNFIAKDTIRNCITKDIGMNDNENTNALMQQVLNQDDTGRNGKTKRVDNIFPTEACADNGG